MDNTFQEIKTFFGFGCMRLPMNGSDVDIEQFKEMTDFFLANGFNYFDTAHGYIDGKSEKAIKVALTSRYDREKFLLTDKLTEPYFNKEEDIRPFFQSQLDAKRLVSQATEALDSGDLETARARLDEAEALGIRNDRDLQYDEVVYLEKTAQWEEAYEEIKSYLNQYPDDNEAQREEKFLSTRISALRNNEAMTAG